MKSVDVSAFAGCRSFTKIQALPEGGFLYEVTEAIISENNYQSGLYLYMGEREKKDLLITRASLSLFTWEDHVYALTEAPLIAATAVTDVNTDTTATMDAPVIAAADTAMTTMNPDADTNDGLAEKEEGSSGPCTWISRWNGETASFIPLLRVKKNVEQALPTEDGKWLLVCRDDLRQELSEDVDDALWYTVEEVPSFVNGEGYRNRVRRRLYLLDSRRTEPDDESAAADQEYALTPGCVKPDDKSAAADPEHVLTPCCPEPASRPHPADAPEKWLAPCCPEPALLTPGYTDVGGFTILSSETALFFAAEYDVLRPTTATLYRLDLKTFAIAVSDPEEYVYSEILPAGTDHAILIRNDRHRYGEYQEDFIDLVRGDGRRIARLNEDCNLHLFCGIVTDMVWGGAQRRFIPAQAAPAPIAPSTPSTFSASATSSTPSAPSSSSTPSAPETVSVTPHPHPSSSATPGVYFLATERDHVAIYYGDFTSGLSQTCGGLRQEDREQGSIRRLTLREDLLITDFALIKKHGKDDHPGLVFAGARGTDPLELYEDSSPLTRWNEAFRQTWRVSPPRPRSIPSPADGTAVDGYVLKPARWEAGRKYPAILCIHGGPNAAYSDCFHHEMQLLAADGYGLIYCNPHGSIGRGGAFADLRLRYYTIDKEDILAFLRQTLLDEPWIDADLLGVCGGSYGGMMVNHLIAVTDHFKAAVSDRSVANEISDFFLSDIGLSFTADTSGGHLWTPGVSSRMWQSSAISLADRITTPTLFIHGAEDYTCTMNQSLQMQAALAYNGIPARALIFRNETHGLAFEGRPKARVKRLTEILRWFGRYLKPEGRSSAPDGDTAPVSHDDFPIYVADLIHK